METIISTVERSAHYVEANKAATELVKALRARLNDTQANLKPIAACALGHMLCAFETDQVQANTALQYRLRNNSVREY